MGFELCVVLLFSFAVVCTHQTNFYKSIISYCPFEDVKNIGSQNFIVSHTKAHEVFTCVDFLTRVSVIHTNINFNTSWITINVFLKDLIHIKNNYQPTNNNGFLDLRLLDIFPSLINRVDDLERLISIASVNSSYAEFGSSVKSQKHSYNLVFGVNTAISKYDIRIEEKDVNNFKNLKEIILPVTFSLELQIKRAGSIDEIDKNSLKLTDLLILLYGYFRDQFVFISNSVDYIYDCHPGNILYFFKENEIVFSWSDFGRSNNYSTPDLKKNDSIFHNKMYFNASIHTFNFIKSMSDNVVLMDILKEIEELSDELKKHSNPKDYFQAMTNKLQLLYEEKLSFGTLKEINKRVGSAIFFFVDNLYKKIDDLIDDVKILKVDSKILKDDNEIIKKENKILKDDSKIFKKDNKILKDDNEIIKKENKNLKNDNEIFKKEIKELNKKFNQFIESSSKNKNHNSNNDEF
jgi:hypothetical protein